ncbi:MAG TPA: hypothetical protein VHY58_08340 [Streptosporangiaceae bacterium]|jgi:hypothetical protein|nr:hypothetical protein [Streptosporangiaceae bacterium]
MSDQMQTFELDFHLEADGGSADLAASADTVREKVSALPGVAEVGARVAEPVRMIDPVSAAAIVLSVTAAIKNAGDLVQSLDDLVNNVKQLAKDAGLPHLWVWLHRKKVKVDDLTPDDLRELAAEATSAD